MIILIFLIGAILAAVIKDKKHARNLAIVLAVLVVISEVLCQTVFDQSYGAMLPMLVGCPSFGLLLGIGAFYLAWRRVRSLCRKHGDD